jgi:hypothetical protein
MRHARPVLDGIVVVLALLVAVAGSFAASTAPATARSATLRAHASGSHIAGKSCAARASVSAADVVRQRQDSPTADLVSTERSVPARLGSTVTTTAPGSPAPCAIRTSGARSPPA